MSAGKRERFKALDFCALIRPDKLRAKIRGEMRNIRTSANNQSLCCWPPNSIPCMLGLEQMSKARGSITRAKKWGERTALTGTLFYTKGVRTEA